MNRTVYTYRFHDKSRLQLEHVTTVGHLLVVAVVDLHRNYNTPQIESAAAEMHRTLCIGRLALYSVRHDDDWQFKFLYTRASYNELNECSLLSAFK